MWDELHRGLEHQTCYTNITWAQVYPNFPIIHPQPAPICPHSQHIKVLKHFVYIWHGCGMHSTGVWSLNHDITTSLRLHPTLHRHNSKGTPIYPYPQHIKVQKHFVYIWHGCGMHSKWIWSLNHDITTSLRLSQTPFFPKSTPDLHKHNRVRAHPYAHPRYVRWDKSIGPTRIWIEANIRRTWYYYEKIKK